LVSDAHDEKHIILCLSDVVMNLRDCAVERHPGEGRIYCHVVNMAGMDVPGIFWGHVALSLALYGGISWEHTTEYRRYDKNIQSLL